VTRCSKVLRLALYIGAILLSASAHAAGANMAAKVRAYAERHNLPVREVPIDLPGRKLTRLFVPVTDASAKDFIEEFTRDSVLLRQSQNDVEHLHMAFAPDQVVWHGGLVPGPLTAPLEAMNGGLYLGVGLRPEHKMHLQQNIGVRAANLAINGRNGGCMWWLVHARVGQDRPLMHELGLKQSMAPSNMVKKMIHAGTDAVVVGVAMSDLAMQPRLLQVSPQIGGYEQMIVAAEQEIAKMSRPNAHYEITAETLRNNIAQQEDTIAMYGALPQHAGHVQMWRNQLQQWQQQLEELPRTYKKPYAEQLAQVDAQILQLENTIRHYGAQPAYVAHIPGWQAQLQQHQQLKAKMIADGEANFDPYALQIEQNRAQMVQRRVQLQSLRAEAAQLKAALQAVDQVARFNALTDAQLMGAPPGGGTLEAVRQ
jgi:hypothetical protein